MEACLILDAGVLLLLENFGLWILFRLIDVTKVQQFALGLHLHPFPSSCKFQLI